MLIKMCCTESWFITQLNACSKLNLKSVREDQLITSWRPFEQYEIEPYANG